MSNSIEQLVQEYVNFRAERLKLQREVDLRYQEELKMRDTIIARLVNRDDIHHIAGYVVQVKSKLEPFIVDFDDLAEYIKKNDALDLLQKRLTPKAVLERIQSGETVPGVGLATKLDLVITEE